MAICFGHLAVLDGSHVCLLLLGAKLSLGALEKLDPQHATVAGISSPLRRRNLDQALMGVLLLMEGWVKNYKKGV